MNKLKEFLINHFNFSPVEIRGFFVLMCLLIFFSILPFAWQKLLPKSKYDRAEDQVILDSLLANMQKREAEKPKVRFVNKKKPKFKTLFQFDPNTTSEKDLIKLGIRDYLAARIVKYRNKGGQFFRKEDLKKIYGFPESLYNELEPYIQLSIIPEKRKNKKSQIDKDGNLEVRAESNQADFKEIIPQKFNLNTADTTQLKIVKGIGTKLAGRIVKFRDKLGGFHTTEQLSEVYGLKPEVSEALLEIADLPQNAHLKKLKVNQLDAKGLQQHPYITWKEANFIIKYRDQHGSYKSIEGIRDIKVFDEAFIKKIAPYISFE